MPFYFFFAYWVINRTEVFSNWGRSERVEIIATTFWMDVSFVRPSKNFQKINTPVFLKLCCADHHVMLINQSKVAYGGILKEATSSETVNAFETTVIKVLVWNLDPMYPSPLSPVLIPRLWCLSRCWCNNERRGQNCVCSTR